MPFDKEKINATVQAAVHEIEATIPIHYPKTFTSIDDAKVYIASICKQADFHYCLRANYNLQPTDPHHTVRIVKDKVKFLVAVRAHDQGEFYLEEPLPDRRSLRDAVEADIARVAFLATKWPTGFADADVAAKRAWEEGKLNLIIWPKEWKRKKAANTLISQSPAPRSTGPQTMTDAIEADIARLLPLVHAWPVRFSDLNEARNYIGSWCHDNKDKFRYTGWADVELRKYCLFVNFNAAKYALEEGLFKVEREMPEKRPFKKSAECGVDKNFEQPNNVQIMEVRVENTGSDAESTGGSSAASSETACFKNEVGAQNEEKEAAAVIETVPTDPFKDLVTELQRGYAVQPAFDLLD